MTAGVIGLPAAVVRVGLRTIGLYWYIECGVAVAATLASLALHQMAQPSFALEGSETAETEPAFTALSMLGRGAIGLVLWRGSDGVAEWLGTAARTTHAAAALVAAAIAAKYAFYVWQSMAGLLLWRELSTDSWVALTSAAGLGLVALALVFAMRGQSVPARAELAD